MINVYLVALTPFSNNLNNTMHLIRADVFNAFSEGFVL
jgi:hypothetical protein